MTEAVPHPYLSRAQHREAAELGIWLFLASEVLFFGGLILAFIVYRIVHPAEFLAGARETEIAFGTANTAVLLTSSLTVALASKAFRLRRNRLTRILLMVTIGLGLCFLVVKGFEYRSDIEKHLVPGPAFALPGAGAQIFWSLYWVLTGVHAIHVTVGLGILAVMAVRLGAPALAPERSSAVEVATLYWHLVDVIWIFLYPMLYLGGRAS